MSKFVKALIATAAATVATIASATPIVGTAQMSFGYVKVTPGNIDFNGSLTGPFDPAPNGSPTFGSFLSSGGTGSFAPLPLTTGNLAHDLSQIPDANFMPIGPSAGLANMFVFQARDGAGGDPTHWMFTATSLAAGDTIASVVTPYVLTQQNTGNDVSTGAQITLTGWACDDTNFSNTCDVGEDKTFWTASISAQYPGYSKQNLIDLLTTGNPADRALPNNVWSGTITARLPEPASLALVGLALAGVGVASRRRQAK